MNKYIIFYNQTSGGFRCWFSDTEDIRTVKILPSMSEYHQFYIVKGYEPNDEGIMNYVNDFKQWCQELVSPEVDKIYYNGIDYAKYKTHDLAIYTTFKRLCKGKYDNHEQITQLESKWMEACNLGGMMYFDKNKSGVQQCYGYDYNSYYPKLLSSKDFLIPTKTGKEVTLKKLPKRDKLKVGYYRVMITSENTEFRKVFAFSKEHTYTHLSLYHAKELRKQFDVTIELIKDDKPNAFVYDKDDCVTGHHIFGKWYETIMKIRKLYPKNKLIKNIGTMLWGTLIQGNKRNVHVKDIEKFNVGIGTDTKYRIIEHVTKSEINDYYIIEDNKKPYKYNMRIKAFLTSQGRNMIAKIALLDLPNVIRIQTDNVTFSCPQDIDPEIMKLEDKTTGFIEWNNVNSYEQVDIEEYIPKKSLF